MRKLIILLFILALIVSSAGCGGKNDKETRVQKASDAIEVRNNGTEATGTPQEAHRPLAERSSSGNNVMSTTNMSQSTVSPTGAEGNPYTEWKYIDPSLVATSGEEDEKLINI